MYKLNIQQEFNTSVAKLFQAWSKPEVMQRWFAPGSMTVPEARADVQLGGGYRIVMQDDDGSQYIVAGTYKEIIENEKLVFSWQWQDSPTTSMVTVVFKALGEQRSMMSLEHDEFEDQEACDKHESGWQGCLANLTKIL